MLRPPRIGGRDRARLDRRRWPAPSLHVRADEGAVGSRREPAGRAGREAGRRGGGPVAAHARTRRDDPRHVARGRRLPAAVHRIRPESDRASVTHERRTPGRDQRRESRKARRDRRLPGRCDGARAGRSAAGTRHRFPRGARCAVGRVRAGAAQGHGPVHDDVDVGYDGVAERRAGAAACAARVRRVHARRGGPACRRPVLEHRRSGLGVRPLLRDHGRCCSATRRHSTKAVSRSTARTT